MVIFCNMHNLSAKSNMTALYRTFQKGTYLAFCSVPPDKSVYSRFKRCLYHYSLEQAVHDGLLLPIRIECKNAGSQRMSSLVPNMVKTLLEQQNARKIMILCTNIVMAERYSKALAGKGVKAYAITTKLQTNELNRTINQFYQAQIAAAFVVDLWSAIDMPELDMIIVTEQLHSKEMLLHLAAKVARTSPGKEYGNLLLFGFPEEL